jgi:hypothetical protein
MEKVVTIVTARKISEAKRLNKKSYSFQKTNSSAHNWVFGWK